MVRVAARKGYEATTVAEVAAAADISRQRFHELFADKEACFLAAYDAAVDILLVYVTNTFESADGSWPDRIVASLRAGIGFLAAEADIARMAVVEVSAVGEDARIRYRQALMRFAPLLDQGRAASPQGHDLPPGTASFAIGAVTSMIFDEIRAGRATELPRILPKLAYSVLMPYLGPEAAEAEMARIEV